MSGFSDGWRVSELVGLAVLTLALLVLWQIPYFGFVVYPFRLFGTFVHELGHGLAALATGGHFERFTVSPDLSGLAWSSGGIRFVIASDSTVHSTAQTTAGTPVACAMLSASVCTLVAVDRRSTVNRLLKPSSTSCSASTSNSTSDHGERRRRPATTSAAAIARPVAMPNRRNG